MKNYRICTTQPQDWDGEIVVSQSEYDDITRRVAALEQGDQVAFWDNYRFEATAAEATSDASDWTPEQLFPALYQ